MDETLGRASKERLEARIASLVEALAREEGGFDTALVVGRTNQYYLTGTMQDGVLVLRSDGSYRSFVRKSYERAREESPLEHIVRIQGYKDMLACLPADLGRCYLETEAMPLAMLDRIRKYFRPASVHALDRTILGIRAVKDPEEIALIEESGRQHAELLQVVLPGLLRAGMSEAELLAEAYAAMIRAGHHGVSRFGMFQMDMVIGQIGFGTNSLYPTNFDGPGGMRGLHPAVPSMGSRDRRLAPGDLVFADVGYGVLGYHSDKTQVYSFRAEPPAAALESHAACRAVLAAAVSMLKPGASAGDVYTKAVAKLPASLIDNFMGYGEPVKFLGHGVGLQIDEAPVIMAANKAPLAAGMIIALEPKRGVEGLGTVGVEETYLVTDAGARCLTGGDRDILVVG